MKQEMSETEEVEGRRVRTRREWLVILEKGTETELNRNWAMMDYVKSCERITADTWRTDTRKAWTEKGQRAQSVRHVTGTAKYKSYPDNNLTSTPCKL